MSGWYMLSKNWTSLSPGHLHLCDPQGGGTPLHCAADNGHKELTSMLLDKGAHLEAKNGVRTFKCSSMVSCRCLHHVPQAMS